VPGFELAGFTVGYQAVCSAGVAVKELGISGPPLPALWAKLLSLAIIVHLGNSGHISLAPFLGFNKAAPYPFPFHAREDPAILGEFSLVIFKLSFILLPSASSLAK